MKTSNKLLLGVLAICFVMPLVLAMSLKQKVKNREFTVHQGNTKTGSNQRTGTFAAFKVVKVTAPHPELLRCNLKLSESMQYKYHKGEGKDSLMVFTRNDTLYINYVAHKGNADENGNGNPKNFQINVKLPSMNNLIVDGAVVIIDSLPATTGPLSITLKNNGVVRDGSKTKKDDNAKLVSPKGVTALSSSMVSNTTGKTNLAPTKPKAVVNPEATTREISMKYFVISGIVL